MPRAQAAGVIDVDGASLQSPSGPGAGGLEAPEGSAENTFAWFNRLAACTMAQKPGDHLRP